MEVEARFVSAGKDDPLVKALIEKLPAAGTNWPEASRAAWLDLMRLALTVLYGEGEKPLQPAQRVAVVTAAARKPAAKNSSRPKAKAKSKAKAKKPSRKSGSKPKAPPAGPAFFIDRDHMAKRRGGERIMPAEIADFIVDLRGERGDLGAITWADGSTGIPKGMQIDITTSA